MLRVGAVCCPLMPIFREREVAFCLRRSRARVLFVPDEARGRNHAGEIAAMLREASVVRGDLPMQLEHVVVCCRRPQASRPARRRVRRELRAAGCATRRRWAPRKPTPPRSTPASRDPRAIAQFLFTSGTSGEPKGVLHRNDVLMRAAAMEVEHLDLGARDRIFVPSPLAHQTGFLYGMWLALVMGVPQIVQPVWNATRALRALNDWEGTFVQAATPFLADLRSGRRKRRARARRAAHLRRDGRRRAAQLGRTRDARVSAQPSAARGARRNRALGSLAAPSDEPAKVWGTDGRALRGIRLRITDAEGRTLAPEQGGTLRGALADDVRGLRRPSRVDGGGLHARRLVPHRRSRRYRRERLHPDHRPRTRRDQPRRRKDSRRRDGAAAKRSSGDRRDRYRRDARPAPGRARLRLRRAAEELAPRFRPDAALSDACQASKYFWPERLEIVESLPRTASGKIQKYRLREMARGLRAYDRDKAGVS